MSVPITKAQPQIPSATEGRLLHEVGEIYAAVDAPHPEMAMMAAVARVVPCYSAVLNAITLRPNRLRSWSSLRPGPVDQQGGVVADHLHRHPTLARLVEAGSHESVRLSDVASSRELSRNPFVAGYYRPNGLRTQVTFAVGPAESEFEGGVWVVGINRLDEGEFSSAELACSDVLRPHLERAIRLLNERRRRAAALVCREGAADGADCGTLAVDVLGNIIDATPAARRMLQRWFKLPENAARLPSELIGRLASGFSNHEERHAAAGRALRWTQTSPEGARLSVHARWTPESTGLVGLWLHETRPAADADIARELGLTPRQAAIARWVGEGKTNPEIALLLEISPRTVDKHVEQILQRLGVENRAAIVRAVRDLGT